MPWGLLSANRNEYLKENKKKSLGSIVRQERKADLTAICEPII
jgi:hypothetical protein